MCIFSIASLGVKGGIMWSVAVRQASSLISIMKRTGMSKIEYVILTEPPLTWQKHGWIERMASKAPLLKGNSCSPFEVVPSGKIQKGYHVSL